MSIVPWALAKSNARLVLGIRRCRVGTGAALANACKNLRVAFQRAVAAVAGAWPNMIQPLLVSLLRLMMHCPTSSASRCIAAYAEVLVIAESHYRSDVRNGVVSHAEQALAAGAGAANVNHTAAQAAAARGEQGVAGHHETRRLRLATDAEIAIPVAFVSVPPAR